MNFALGYILGLFTVLGTMVTGISGPPPAPNNAVPMVMQDQSKPNPYTTGDDQ